METERQGALQRAYRVLVASTPDQLLDGKADVWDSGRVEGSHSSGIRLAARALTSRQRYHWTVTVWDDENQQSSATPSWWEMGLLLRTDWTGAWLAAEDQVERGDREVGMAWVEGPDPGPKSSLRFQIPFIAEGTGTVLVTIGLLSQTAIALMSIDETPVQIEPVRGFIAGGLPTIRIELPIGSGAHSLQLALRALPQMPILPPVGRIGAGIQLRLTDTHGKVTRVSDGVQIAREGTDGSLSWVPAQAPGEQPDPPWPPSPARLFRRPFVVRQRVRSARLYVAALGGYEMRLNGRKIFDDLLAPETTDFRCRMLYRTHDVTNDVTLGENVLSSIVGDGWYASYQTPARRYAYGPAPRRFLVQLELMYEDGSIEKIVTDREWRTHESPIRSSEIYDGEVYDARLEQPGWDQVGFDDNGWSEVWTALTPAAALVAAAGAPIRATMTLKPVAITAPTPGVQVFDFGQNFAGWARLKVKGSSGQTIALRFAEVLKPSGEVDQTNLRMARARDIYVTRGDPEGETHEPRFTYHGFRYVQVEGAGKSAACTIEGIVIHTDLSETGQFYIDAPVIQKLWLSALWGQRSNFVGIPTDCPQRDERLGWAGDAQIFWDAAAFNMDVGDFTRRYMNDLRDGQSEKTGAFPMWAPKPDEPLFPTLSATPGWADAGIVLPWTAFMHYGDRSIVDENWQAMTRYIEGILRANSDHLWREGRGYDLGDWLALDTKEGWDDTTPKDLIATALLARSCDQLADMGDATGRNSEAAEYRERALKVRRAFAETFVKADGVVGNGSQTSYIIALRLDCVPSKIRQVAGARLVEEIRRRGNVLATGFLGTPFSLDALADCGHSEIVYDLLLRTAFPSWGYMTAHGATTIWERWNSDTSTIPASFNHYALGAVSGFLYRRVAGIDPIAPGCARIRVNPVLDPRIRSAGAEYDSVRGRISIRWTVGQRLFELDLVVPPNASAEVHLPGGSGSIVKGNGRVIDRSSAIHLLSRSPGATVLEVESGNYHFSVSG